MNPTWPFWERVCRFYQKGFMTKARIVRCGKVSSCEWIVGIAWITLQWEWKKGKEGHPKERSLRGLRLGLRGGPQARCTQEDGMQGRSRGVGRRGGRTQVETRWGLLPYMASTLSPGYYYVQPAIYSLMIHLPYLPSQPALHSGGKTVLEARGTLAALSGCEEPKESQPWSPPLRSSPPSGGERQVSAPMWGRGYTGRTPDASRAPCQKSRKTSWRGRPFPMSWGQSQSQYWC